MNLIYEEKHIGGWLDKLSANVFLCLKIEHFIKFINIKSSRVIKYKKYIDSIHDIIYSINILIRYKIFRL